MKFKIHGQKRCGTNLMQRLLEDAGHMVLVNEHGWKHGPVQPDIFDHVDHVVICTRNPAAWLVSNRKHDARINWEEERWTSVSEWAAREHAYYQWAAHTWSDDATLVDTMSLITCPTFEMQRFHRKGWIGPVDMTNPYNALPRNKMAMNGQEDPREPMDFRYYLEQRYLEELEREDWEAIQLALSTYPDTLGEVWQRWMVQVRRIP